MYTIGDLTTGGFWFNGIGEEGTLTSASGFPLQINATSVHIDDFTANFERDGPNKVHLRGLLLTDDGEYIGVEVIGLLDNTQAVQDIINKKPGAKPTEWGSLNTFTTWSFQAAKGSKYADLTTGTFVANFRMWPYEADDSFAVEYHLSKVLPGKG